MKLIFCLECGDIFSPGKDAPSRCRCGYALGQWKDAERGILAVDSRGGKAHLRVLGINNDWLMRAAMVSEDVLTPHELDEVHRDIAGETCEAAHGYLFQTRHSPIIMVKPIAVVGTADILFDDTLHTRVPWYGKFDVARPEGGGSLESGAEADDRAPGGEAGRDYLVLARDGSVPLTTTLQFTDDPYSLWQVRHQVWFVPVSPEERTALEGGDEVLIERVLRQHHLTLTGRLTYD